MVRQTQTIKLGTNLSYALRNRVCSQLRKKENKLNKYKMIFNEDKLQEEIIKTWGEHGAHIEVFKNMRQQIKDLTKQLNIPDVVNWLPFKPANYKLFMELAKKGKLLKCYDDGTIIKDGEEEPLAIMTHFAEQV